MLQPQIQLFREPRISLAPRPRLFLADEDLIGPVTGWLLTLVLPFTVFWIPLIRLSGVGTLTALDVVSVLLYAVTLLRLGLRHRISGLEVWAIRILLWALAPALFQSLGAFSFDASSSLVYEVLQHTKRFGFAAIIPLAMLMAPRRFIPRIRIAAMLSLLAATMVPLTPIADLLPSNELKATLSETGESRTTGSLTNPNDFAYVALIVTLIGLSHATATRGSRLVRRLWATVAVGAGLTALITAASRSGMMAAFVAVFYVVTQSTLTFAKKVVAVVMLAATMLVGWQGSALYQSRMTEAINQDVADSSFLARFDAQSVAAETWLHHPLGVGFANMPAATAEFAHSQFFDRVGGSDSIYFDYLIGAGAFGLLSIVLCFRHCWKIASFHGSSTEVVFLKAGIIAAFVFGTATISPASVFVSPFFFVAVGLAACAHRDASSQLVHGT